MEKRKIIEIYVEEDKETTTFTFENVDKESKISNKVMKMLIEIFSCFSGIQEDK